MQVPGFEITCPRWALPREEIPVHVKMNKHVMRKIDCVRIFLDERLKLADTINVSEYEVGRTVTVREIGKSARSDYDYFGIVVATKTAPDSLKTQIPIPMDAVYRDGTKERRFAHARIFRPRVEFASMPEKLVLSDAGGESAVQVGLKFLGFGEIRLRAECRTGGRIISEGPSLPHETRRGTVGQYAERAAGGPELEAGAAGRTIRERRTGDSAGSPCEPTRSGGRKPAGAVGRAAEQHLSQTVSEMLGRHLGYNSRLESQTQMRYSRRAPSPRPDGGSPQEPRSGAAPTRPPRTKVQVRFFYKDNMENEYGPIERTISIVDKRAGPAGSEVVIPVRVGVDESGAYENVGGMEIGS